MESGLYRKTWFSRGGLTNQYTPGEQAAGGAAGFPRAFGRQQPQAELIRAMRRNSAWTSEGQEALRTAGLPPQRRGPVAGDPGQETGATSFRQPSAGLETGASIPARPL